jgi:regulatory protein
MDKCTSRALYLLGARAYTEHKLREKLGGNYPPETVDKAVLWLTERQFLDDRKYAENRLDYLRRVKKYGIIRIKNDLRTKGVPDDIIKEIITAEAQNETDYTPLIIERIKKKHTENLKSREGEAKIYSSMARYGFLYKDVKKAIAEIKKEL